MQESVTVPPVPEVIATIPARINDGLTFKIKIKAIKNLRPEMTIEYRPMSYLDNMNMNEAINEAQNPAAKDRAKGTYVCSRIVSSSDGQITVDKLFSYNPVTTLEIMEVITGFRPPEELEIIRKN